METLYRKYRPLDFDTVVGQDVIVKTLRNQILKGSIAHAYLFCGTRGTGKTTIAKIFARAINCPNENNGNPCNECNACKSALDGANYNILEMDAASNRGVEDIRKITEAISYPPINDQKYKVFIIDEAHALTDTAVQAFLKSLEEPPEYVVFILATTDPNKLPETILSRCQKYNFKRISVDEIAEYLKKICVEEKIDIDDDALVFIAEKSDGSMRESISKLDRCRAYAPNDKFDK
ncbi:MAG: DNA polymerase III subunit gamma/tau, partial [Lachnospiraceae bacterium]|nr:DNA polymerase III subunit gamma/tau [Lachnospiraceae bacterium]